MEENMEIVKALNCCSGLGNGVCEGCPYNGTSTPSLSCRARLCLEAAEVLAEATKRGQAMSEEVEDLANERTDLLNKLNDMQKKLAEKQTSVCSDAEGLKTDVIKLAEAVETFKREANYWHGQADALKWFVEFYFLMPTQDNEDGVEVPDDV